MTMLLPKTNTVTVGKYCHIEYFSLKTWVQHESARNRKATLQIFCAINLPPIIMKMSFTINMNFTIPCEKCNMQITLQRSLVNIYRHEMKWQITMHTYSIIYIENLTWQLTSLDMVQHKESIEYRCKYTIVLAIA